MPSDKQNTIEHKTLMIGLYTNLIMAAAGWYMYFITDSEALLLDGNFSFIAALAAIVGIYIANVRGRRSETFPFGLYLYESLFVFFKGLVLLGVIITAVFQNVLVIIRYFAHGIAAPITYGPILLYSLSIGALCFSVSAYFRYQNKKAERPSQLITVESKGLMIDGVLSLVLGISFLIISQIPIGTSLDFLHYIGDAVLVILLSILFLKTPLVIIKDAFIEIGGGRLQDKESHDEIEAWIKEGLDQSFEYKHSYINRAGSSFLAIIYIKAQTEQVDVALLSQVRDRIETKLKSKYYFTEVEIILW